MTLARRKEAEFLKTQELLRDFPNLKVGELLPDPDPKGRSLAQFLTQEWTVIMAPHELELQRGGRREREREGERDIAHYHFYDKPDEQGMISALRSTPSRRPMYQEWHGRAPH